MTSCDLRASPLGVSSFCFMVFGIVTILAVATSFIVRRTTSSFRAFIAHRIGVMFQFVGIALATPVVTVAHCRSSLGDEDVRRDDFHRAFEAFFSMSVILFTLDFVLFSLFAIATLSVLRGPSRDDDGRLARFGTRIGESLFEPEIVEAIRNVGAQFIGNGRYKTLFPDAEVDDADAVGTTTSP